MNSQDKYIVKIRDLWSQNSLFSREELSVLTSLFESLSGRPPSVHAERFRADHHQELNALDSLENPRQFLKRIAHGKFYVLSPYALPLVEVARAVRLLEIMEKIYKNLRGLYQEYLTKPIEVTILIDGIDGYDRDEMLEALYYLSELNGVWSAKIGNFPYAEESMMSIAESVLRSDSVGDMIMKYFDAFYEGSISPSSHNSSMPLERDVTKLTGADNVDEEIQPEQPKMLGNLKWVQQNWRIFLKPKNLLVAFVALSLFFYFILR